MGILFKTLLACATISVAGSLFAADGEGVPKKPEAKKEAAFASELDFFYDAIGQAKIRNRNHPLHRKLSYQRGGVYVAHTEECDSHHGVNYGIGYRRDHFHWNHKKKFHQENFNNLNLDFGTFAKEMDGWNLEARIGLQMNTDHFSISRYTLFQGYVQGSYHWKENMNLYIGMTGVTGMRATTVLPVLGFDYKASDKWKFNFILPYNIAAMYSFYEGWTLSAALRPFYSVQRLDKHDERHGLRRGLIRYRNTGAELGLDYRFAERFSASVHVGETFGGRLRISNHAGKHRQHLKVGSSPYAGATLGIAF